MLGNLSNEVSVKRAAGTWYCSGGFFNERKFLLYRRFRKNLGAALKQRERDNASK